MQNIMLSLETLATSPDAAISAIGAVKFDLDRGVYERFYVNVDVQSCVGYCMHIDVKTLRYWINLPDNAMTRIFGENSTIITQALIEFSEFVGPEGSLIWANGAEFHNTILGEAYLRCNIEKPWQFYHNRCARTIRESFLQSTTAPWAVAGNISLKNAENQALYLLGLSKKYNLDRLFGVKS